MGIIDVFALKSSRTQFISFFPFQFKSNFKLCMDWKEKNWKEISLWKSFFISIWPWFPCFLEVRMPEYFIDPSKSDPNTLLYRRLILPLHDELLYCIRIKSLLFMLLEFFKLVSIRWQVMWGQNIEWIA